ncbi:hypothetical protein [Marinimicrococcus flavescens]|uniref:Yip1 domain-containing protein n=1 Tax=Marinimicrococcus flavescens TaxID=3031815 RepID=A0AAP3UYU0_9PROT|nr:hypothetical protein [Marinimicrococcus flavescens]
MIDEIKRSLLGAWLLARQNTRGMELFDLSVEGFFRSFMAALVAAPVYLLLTIDRYQTAGMPAELGSVVALETVSYALSWIAFPLVAILLTRLLGLGHRYVPLIVAGNWAAVLQVGFFLVALLLSAILPPAMRALLLFAATVAVLLYQWFVIRTALGTTGGTAAGVLAVNVLLDTILSLLTGSVALEGG